MSEQDDRNFMRYLIGLREHDQRAALAALRRGLGKPPGSEPLAYPYVVPKLPDDLRCDDDEAPYYLVGSLFALHPVDTTAGNMGNHLRDLARQTGADEPPPNIERRFVLLLSSHPRDLYKLLQPAVNLLKAGNVPIHWFQLLRDLKYWQHSDSRSDVRREWATSFWRHEHQPSVSPQSNRS